MDRIRQQVSAQRFDTWFAPIRPLEIGPDRILIEVPNPFFIDYFEGRNLNLLRSGVRDVLGEELEIHWSVHASYYEAAERSAPGGDRDRLAQARVQAAGVSPAGAPPRAHSYLNPRYCFENFVVGPSNELSRAACFAVARQPGQAYNPLFIYGPTGLGKTHLMQAVGNLLLRLRPSSRLVYVYCERFVNELIECIARGQMSDFRSRYRNLDVLLIDDIHFLGGKETTQEEFFHTFNVLHDSGKQIVMASDRPPGEIRDIQQRLMSRFHWGLVTDIHPPSLETRLAILERRAHAEGIYLPSEVAHLIASRVRSNIRALEGCLVRLAALSRLLGVEASPDLAHDVLRDVLEPGELPGITVEEIQGEVARLFEVTEESLRGKRRTNEIALARQIAMYLARHHTSQTLQEIGRSFGHRDHSTVLHACGKIARMRVRDERVERALQTLDERLRRLPADRLGPQS